MASENGGKKKSKKIFRGDVSEEEWRKIIKGIEKEILRGSPVKWISKRFKVDINTVYYQKKRILEENFVDTKKKVGRDSNQRMNKVDLVSAVAGGFKKIEQEKDQPQSQEFSLTTDLSEEKSSADVLEAYEKIVGCSLSIIDNGLESSLLAAKLSRIIFAAIANELEKNKMKDEEERKEISEIILDHQKEIRMGLNLLHVAADTKKKLVPEIDKELSEKLYEAMVEKEKVINVS